jgi:putative membrane protein
MTSPLKSAEHFLREAFTMRGAATVRVLPVVLVLGGVAALVCLAQHFLDADLSIPVGPLEVAGACLGVMLALRVNAGYDRWWEARKLWGGIVNQSRNLVLTALAHGPADRRWRERVVRWAAAFGHAARGQLRGERDLPELVALLGKEQADRVSAAEHMPSFVAQELAGLLGEGRSLGLNDFAFLAAERERAGLIDHVGGCERIRNTPLARLYSLTVRRFLFLFFASLPFALLHKFADQVGDWLVPLVTMLAAYPALSIDQTGMELQQPFATRNLSHLPLDEICHNLERNLLALLAREQDDRPAS